MARAHAAALLAFVVAPALLPGCDGAGGFDWRLPRDFPRPIVPDDNPMSVDKVELGRRLFYDRRLSGNQTYACATCHVQSRAFTDDRAGALGSTGQVHPRGSMAVVNVVYNTSFGWANPNLRELEQQALVPMFGESPVELGLAGKDAELISRLRAEPQYQRLFPLAFPEVVAAGADPIDLANLVRAISAFERTLISGDSPYDRWQAGDESAVDDSVKRGYEFFVSETTECFHCHGTFNFTDAVRFEGRKFTERPFHNNGLYNIGGTGAYPPANIGLKEITGVDEDMGRFKAPTLRNIAVTAPYMHDGSIATLDEVIDHYAAGGRTIASGDKAGVGSASPYKDGFVVGFKLTPQERANLIAFFKSLTDDTFLTDPRFSDPWK